MNRIIDTLAHDRAAQLQSDADKLTAFRGDKAKYLGAAIGLSRRRWSTTAAASAFMLTDWIDGRMAKKAQRIVETDQPLTNGAREDPRMDKKLMWSLWAGVAARAALEGDEKTLAALASVSAITYPRDTRIEKSRQIAEDNELKVGVSAINKNRFKTAGQAISTVVLLCPLSNNERVKDIALAGLAASTAIGYAGERTYTGIVNQQMSERAAACPDRLHLVTDAPAYTSPGLASVTPLFETRSEVQPAPPRVARHS